MEKIRRLVLISIFCLSGCFNPSESVKPYVESFKKNYPGNFSTYTSDSRKIHFAFAGDANNRPLILVHGSPGSWDGWAQFLENEKLKSQYHILVPDRPGYGDSDYGVPEKSLDQQAKNMIDILQFNKSQKKAILVGHSYGGPVIVKMALNYPDQVAGIILVAASVDPELEKTKWIQYPGAWWPIKSVIPKFLMVCNEEILPLQQQLQDMLPLWGTLKVPVISIHGTLDDLVPIGNQDFQEKRIPAHLLVQKERIEGLNHFIPWKRPDLIFSAIDTIVTKVQQ